MFPNERELPDEDLLKKAVMWADILSPITYRQAIEALKKYCATSTSGFAPQPAHILNFARQEHKLSDVEIKLYLSRALCDSAYHSEEQFERLPNELKHIIGSPRELQRQASRPQDDSNIFIMSVCKEYRQRADNGTLDNTLLLTSEDRARIGQTMAALVKEVNTNDRA